MSDPANEGVCILVLLARLPATHYAAISTSSSSRIAGYQRLIPAAVDVPWTYRVSFASLRALLERSQVCPTEQAYYTKAITVHSLRVYTECKQTGLADSDLGIFIMLGSVLPFSPELADKVSEYCENHSEALPEALNKHWEWTIRTWMDAEMMSSKLQGQWMIWMSQWMAPKRVLEVGTFTGFSALAWYEGTRATKAEIITLDVRGEVLNFTRKMFSELGVDDRIKVVEGPAASTLEQVEGQFDIIFLDADKHNYQLYMNTILERRLLSPHGVVFVDNVFARGLTMGNEFNPYIEKIRRPFWEANGETLRKLNTSFLEDPRIDTLILPLFDGVTQIKWKTGYLEPTADGTGKQ